MNKSLQVLCLLREHGQLHKDAKAAIHGRSARAVHGAGRFATLTVFPARLAYKLLIKSLLVYELLIKHSALGLNSLAMFSALSAGMLST